MRVRGIEPPTSAWKADVLPLNYTRKRMRPILALFDSQFQLRQALILLGILYKRMVEILNNVLAGILTAYLAFTSILADQFLAITNDNHENSAVVIEVSSSANSNTEAVDQDFENSHVDLLSILADSAVDQEAAVIEAVATTSEETEAVESPEPELEVPITVADALVNIYCTYRTESSLKATTGTGFFVGKNGVILTNAHVAMFYLLEDLNGKGRTRCLIRSGDPATAKYYAELLYISPRWVSDNADVISSKNPTGTGERDFALLYVSESAKGEHLPTTFPALPVDTNLLDRLDRDNQVTVGGYPVTNPKTIGSTLILNPAVATSSVTHIYTFGGKHGDLVALRGTNAGQHGMSGGPVVNEAGRTIGLISTKGDDEENGVGSLNAITISYIHRTLREETSFGFTESLNGNLPYRAQVFRENLQPFLTSILAEEL